MADDVHLTQHTWFIDLDSPLQGYFQEMGDLTKERETKDYHETAKGQLTTTTVAGPSKPNGEITLKRAARGLDDWERWFDEVDQGTDTKKTGTLSQEDRAGNKVKQYNLEGVLPKKIKIPGFKAGSSDIPIEEVTLTYDRMVLK